MFVPLLDDQAETVVAWNPRLDVPTLHNLIDLVTELAASTDLTEAG
ncbi:hypothetical protein JOL79_15995 [Microbispora sp. RL4-1S]|uniref:Uncharacterized protein n=1 Tax=Microbispora oryzae TaxID=2806554 RepID=A0A940WLS9_9ACTN|nr:hypothetical protein [Microbispora oryzae]MBP2705318.1 hypothetical protein [Microbispora oryzae]